MKTRKIFVFCALILFLSAFSAGAQPQVCQAPFEAIVTLRPPRLGIPTVWDATYGQADKMTQLFSGLPLPAGTMFVLGRTLSKDELRPEKLVLAEINRRGRVMNEKDYPTKEAETPVKMIAIKGGYLVVSDISGGEKKERRQIRLSWYDDKGDFKKDKILKDDTYDYNAYGLVPAVETAGFVVIAHAISHAHEDDQHGVLVRFTPDGEQVWRRAYRPGIPNQLRSLDKLSEDTYLASGRIRMEDGRMGGWVMKLSFDGTVLWQRTYPRGAFSVVKKTVPMEAEGGAESRGFILLGDVMPLDRSPGAAWILAVNAAGETLWQRYLRRPDYAMTGVGLARDQKDGRIMLVVNAQARGDSGGRDHVRLITIAPYGAVIQDESYIEGIQAEARDLVTGWNGERIVTATIHSDAQPLDIEMVGDTFVPVKAGEKAEGPSVEQKKDGKADEKKEPPILKGWVFVATALDIFKDPCAAPADKTAP